MMQEKKQLEEELNRLRNSALVSSAFFPSNSAQDLSEAGAAGRALPVAGACSPETPAEMDRLAPVATFRDDERVDSAVEASLVAAE